MGEQSLTRKILTVFLVVGVGVPGGWAMSYCSSSFRFDRLCPDPRFGSRKAGSGVGSGDLGRPHALPDTTINLNVNNNNNYYLQGRGGGGGGGSGGNGYPPSMSVKDPATTSCDFYRNGMETAVVTAVHVTKNPWNFRHANQCNHIIKFNYGVMMEGRGGGGGGSGGSGEVGGRNGGADKQSVCQNKIGIQRQASQDKDRQQHRTGGGMEQSGKYHREESHGYNYQGGYEDNAKKSNVYFWHNFTLYPYSAEFVDVVTNYHLAREDIACVGDKLGGQFAQIVVVISRSGRCEIIVQQYKIDDKRSPFGCSDAAYTTPYPTPHPVQFCGSYDCVQSNNILTGLKLLRRRDVDTFENSNSGGQYWDKGSPSEKNKQSQGFHHSHPYHKSYDYGEGTNSGYSENEEGAGQHPHATEIVTTPSSSKTYLQPSSGGETSENEEDKVEPMDWMEMLFLFAFPVGGVVFILVVLAILRSKSAREICRGYSYPRPQNGPQHPQHPHQQGSIYQGSFNSIDKNTMPI